MIGSSRRAGTGSTELSDYISPSTSPSVAEDGVARNRIIMTLRRDQLQADFKREEYSPNDARSMSPRRNRFETELCASNARGALQQ